MALTADKIFVLAVALLTWGGVYVYLLRLDKLAKALEEEVRARDLDEAKNATPPLAAP